MRDPTSLEPKNGDFVAYVEALQADQAALLKAANSGRRHKKSLHSDSLLFFIDG